MVECGNLTLKALWNESTSASKELGDKVSKWCVHVHIHGNNWSNECARACMGGGGGGGGLDGDGRSDGDGGSEVMVMVRVMMMTVMRAQVVYQLE